MNYLILMLLLFILFYLTFYDLFTVSYYRGVSTEQGVSLRKEKTTIGTVGSPYRCTQSRREPPPLPSCGHPVSWPRWRGYTLRPRVWGKRNPNQHWYFQVPKAGTEKSFSEEVLLEGRKVFPSQPVRTPAVRPGGPGFGTRRRWGQESAECPQRLSVFSLPS